MPEHNEESLGTRDLASPSGAGATATTAESDQTAEADRADDRADHRDDAPTNEPLLPSDVTGDFQRRWEEVQAQFVDEPRGAVEQADGLVAKLMQQLAEVSRWSASSSRHSGGGARTSRPRTCGWRCNATARSSSGCCRPSSAGGTPLGSPVPHGPATRAGAAICLNGG